MTNHGNASRWNRTQESGRSARLGLAPSSAAPCISARLTRGRKAWITSVTVLKGEKGTASSQARRVGAREAASDAIPRVCQGGRPPLASGAVCPIEPLPFVVVTKRSGEREVDSSVRELSALAVVLPWRLAGSPGCLPCFSRILRFWLRACLAGLSLREDPPLLTGFTPAS